MLIKVWSGRVQFVSETLLEAKSAQFVRQRVANRDKLVLLAASSPDVAEKTSKVETEVSIPELDCVRAVTETTLEVRLETFDAQLLTSEFELQVWRNLERPCSVCERAGLFEESDHKHCEISRERLPLSYPHAFSTGQREKAMTELLHTGAFVMTVPLFNSKRTITVHSTTFAENDAKREWEQELVAVAANHSVTYYAEQEARVHAAYALDDDGTGKGPFTALTPEQQALPAPVRSKLMMDFFKGYSDSAYRILLEQIRRLDSLVEEVCAERLTDHYTEDDFLALCEDLAVGAKVVSEVRYFGDKGKVYFTNASTGDVDKAREWAENLIRDVRRDNNGTILQARAQDLETLALLACEFRGDQRRRFTDDSDFNDRVLYLMELPMPLFYLYVRAGNIWRLRTFKAAEPATVGNF